MNAAMKVLKPASQKSHSRRRVVIPAWEDKNFSSYALGGKGHGIARLMALGLPTPPALVISTTLARSVAETGGRLPERFHPQLEREMKALEMRTGKRFGDAENPLLVSVRSGAMVSMPGMMDTILNVGLTPKVSDAFEQMYGEMFVTDCHRHLMNALGGTWYDKNDERGSALRQLTESILKVLHSWHSPRAKAYRREHGIADNLGTAITIQQMVFGNLTGEGESGTGVAMSHNPDTAEPILFGNYLRQAQGHDLVSGEITPESILTLETREPVLMAELKRALAVLQQEVSGPVEVEFTIENGVLYLLQFRREKLSPEATIVHLVHEKHAGRMTRDAVIGAVSDSVVTAVTAGVVLAVDPRTIPTASLLGTGTGVTNNAATGFVVCHASVAQLMKSQGKPYILVREHTTPDDFELMLGSSGIITLEGGSTCHAAVVARHQGIPAVIGVGQEVFNRLAALSGIDYQAVRDGVTINPVTGEIWSGQLPLVATTQRKEVELFLRWKSANKPVFNPDLCCESIDTNQALNDFYLGEAMLVECTDEALSAKIRTLHTELTNTTAAVFSTYLPLAVASEISYTGRAGLEISDGGRFTELQKKFTLKHRNHWSGMKAPDIALELVQCSRNEVAEFFATCEAIFHAPGWSGSVGGRAWAMIAAVGKQYWQGDIPAAIFVDRVFNLQHNTGPVFNKHGMVSNQYDSDYLQRQLDLKRKEMSVKEKYHALRSICGRFNQQLLELYWDGHRKGVWK